MSVGAPRAPSTLSVIVPVRDWWRDGRHLYNRVALFGFAVATLLGARLLLQQLVPVDGVFWGGILFALFAGVPYMLAANLCYSIGPLVEMALPLHLRMAWRQTAYRAGMSLAVLVPSAGFAYFHACREPYAILWV